MRVAPLLLLIACTHAKPVTPITTITTPGAVASPAIDATLSAPLGQRVLLVATGFGAERDAITAADAKRDYCAGTIGVLAAARPVADRLFGCPGTPMTIAAFMPLAKTRAIVIDLAHATAQLKALAVDGANPFTAPATYPLVHGAHDDLAPHLTHFILTGVTAITRATGAAIDEHSIDWYTAKLRPSFEGAQYVHISNEVSIKDKCEYPVKGTYTFCTKERDFQALIDLHANLIELTGNHTRDFGDEPFRKTMAWYAAHHMKTFGGGLTPAQANEPVVIDLADGKRMGLLAFNEACPLKECAIKPDEVGANAYDRTKAKAGIEALRAQKVDFVAVHVQFKEWDSPKPTATQAVITHDLVDMGADYVYGSQAHQLQVIEFYKGKPIFHGLGNLLFDQIHRIGVRQAFFVHNYFFDGRLVQSIPVWTWMGDDRQPGLATPEQAAEMKAIAFQDDLLYTAP